MTGSQPLSDARAEALGNLRRAMDALRPHMDTADQQADLLLIEEAVTRLSVPRGPDRTGLFEFDPSRLGHLLEITGPELGQELLARLTEDLTSTRTLLASGAAGSDWLRVREGSHVLISLSGSVGALSLQAMAESLNAIAHRQDKEAMDALMPPFSGELDALIRLISATKAPIRTSE